MQSKSVAMVTGASQGIGRATAIRLARDFEAVVLAARQEEELKKTAAAVEVALKCTGAPHYGTHSPNLPCWEEAATAAMRTCR